MKTLMVSNLKYVCELVDLIVTKLAGFVLAVFGVVWKYFHQQSVCLTMSEFKLGCEVIRCDVT